MLKVKDWNNTLQTSIEKSQNKKSTNRMYDNLNEALHNQKKHGGKVFAINECHMEEVDTWKPCEYGN